MRTLPPPVEVLPDDSRSDGFLPPSDTGFRPRTDRRPIIFGMVLAVCLAASLAYVWGRPALYRSAASLLTTAPPAIDEIQTEASVQHVTLQRQTLLGVPLLEETLRRLREANDPPGPPALSVDDLQAMLSVETIPDTNMVELRAQGSEPSVLAPVVNAWIDAYQSLRERETRESKDTTASALREEFDEVGIKIEQRRNELDRFRRDHNIVSRKDLDNQAMARLSGLNTSLNKASEEEVAARAKLDAIREALARGEPVVPPSDERSLAELERRAQELREMVSELRRRYTPQYISVQPQLKVIPEQLAQLEAEIKNKRDMGRRAAVNEAERAYASARQSVRDLQAQIQAHRREASAFTANFAEHEAREKDLQELEKVYRETQARLVQVQARPREKYPQLQVVDRAFPPTHPVSPDYWRDSGFALLGSLGTAVLLMLLYDYLVRREPLPAPMRLPDIRVYSVPENILLHHQQQQTTAPVLPETRNPALESPFPRELSEPEIRQLLEAADSKVKQLVGLLLSGLSLEEAAALREEHLDFAAGRLLVGGSHSRSVPLAQRLRAWLAEADPKPLWASAPPPDTDDLAAWVDCAAVDAGLAEPHTVDAAALRHTYIVYLVRQGIRLTDLEHIVGATPAKTAASYGRYAPPGPKLRSGSVPLIHPVLDRNNLIEH